MQLARAKKQKHTSLQLGTMGPVPPVWWWVSSSLVATCLCSLHVAVRMLPSKVPQRSASALQAMLLESAV